MKYLTNPQNILRSVDIVFQVFAKAAHKHDGLFPAVTERQNGLLLMDFPLPPCIPGQRNSDRSPRGCNLQHDIPLLATLDGLGRGLNRERYLLQREAYLKTFATVCAPPSPTGLLPWGEHSFWSLTTQTIGNSYLLQYGEQPLDAGIPTHHQLFPLPFDQWQQIHAANPDALPRFVNGLDWHWMDEARTQFNRHAQITQFIRGYQIKRQALMSGKPVEEIKGSDFPGAAGVFIHDYAAAIALCDSPDPAWKEALLRFSDYWWEARGEDGVCPKNTSKGNLNWNGASLGQTMGLAGPTLGAAEMLKEADPELSQLLRERGESYIRAMLNYDQPDTDKGWLYTGYNPDGSPFTHSQPWAGNRGQPCTAIFATKLLNAAQCVGDSRGLELVAKAAEPYHEAFIPRDQLVRAGDMGAVISLTGELYRLTGEQRWLDTAMSHATDALELFFDSPLPRMSLGRSHYEPQQGSSVLVHALARLVMIAEGNELVGGLAEAM